MVHWYWLIAAWIFGVVCAYGIPILLLMANDTKG